MAIGYTEIDFLNRSAPALNATNLNKMDEAIKDACDLLDAETVAGRALVEATDADAQRTLLNVEDGADVTANNAPKAHTASHKHGGTDEIATATPAPNAIPKADGSGKLDGWITGGAPTATQTAGRIPLYNAAAGLNANGISFPATQAPSADANTLDDYEEGTWTPTFTGGTGDSTGTSIEVVGNYVKIGNEVTAWASYKFTSIGGWTEHARFGGFPFTPASTDSFSISSPELVAVDIPQNCLYITCQLYKSTRLFMYLSGVRDDATQITLSAPAFDSSSCIVKYQIKYTV